MSRSPIPKIVAEVAGRRIHGEWFLDKKKNILYYYPPDGLDLHNAVLEVAGLKHLVEMRGTSQSPVKCIQGKATPSISTLTTSREIQDLPLPSQPSTNHVVLGFFLRDL